MACPDGRETGKAAFAKIGADETKVVHYQLDYAPKAGR